MRLYLACRPNIFGDDGSLIHVPQGVRDVSDIINFFDNTPNSAEAFADFLPDGPHSVEIPYFERDLGTTDFIKILFSGSFGRSDAGDAPTTGIIG